MNVDVTSKFISASDILILKINNFMGIIYQHLLDIMMKFMIHYHLKLPEHHDQINRYIPTNRQNVFMAHTKR